MTHRLDEATLQHEESRNVPMEISKRRLMSLPDMQLSVYNIIYTRSKMMSLKYTSTRYFNLYGDIHIR